MISPISTCTALKIPSDFIRLGRAELALRRGDASFADATARRAATEFAAAGEPVREGEAKRLAGVACTMNGKHSEARALLDFAVERARQHGGVLHEAEALRSRAEFQAVVGDPHAPRAPSCRVRDARQRCGSERADLPYAE